MPTEDQEKKEEKVLTDDEQFDQAWDEDESEESPKPEGESSEAEGTPNEDSDGQSQDDDQAGESEATGTPEEESAGTDESAQDSNSDVANLQAQIEQLQAENANLQQKMRSWDGRIRAANKRAAEAEEKLKQAQEAQDKAGTDSLPDGEDDAVLSEFIDEFPTLEKPIKALIKKVAGSMVKAELGKVETQVKEIKDTQVASDTASHAQRINEAHPDWKQIYDSGKLTTWINSQPTFVQRTLNDIVEDGSTEDIIEMFDQFKAATKPAETDQSTTSSQSTGRSKSERAAAMQAVPAKTGGPPKPKPKVAKDDFDAAWDEAISKT